MQKQEKSHEQVLEEEKIIQLIIFLAGNEEFGVAIDAVREIIKIGIVTPIPNSPDFIKGIINVRGEIVTAIDIKSRFHLPTIKETNPKHIVVTKQEEGLFGLIVDEVVEVLRIQQNEIKPPPALVTQIHKRFISGVVSHESRLIIILDLSSILSQKELLQYSNLQRKNSKEKPKVNNTNNELTISNETKTKKSKK